MLHCIAGLRQMVLSAALLTSILVYSSILGKPLTNKNTKFYPYRLVRVRKPGFGQLRFLPLCLGRDHRIWDSFHHLTFIPSQNHALNGCLGREGHHP